MSGFCDIHTHVLPGVDDGAKNWDVCLEMIDRAWNGGVRQMIATPHYLPWAKNENKPETLVRLCRETELRAKQELGHEIKIYPGQEIFYHIDMDEGLRKGEILTLAGSRYILVEFPLEIPYQTLSQAVKRWKSQNFQPVLAHVERYACLRDRKHFEELTGSGAMLQVNVHAIDGGFMDKTARWCKKQLLDKNIHFIASDMHNLDTRPPISYEKLEWVGKKLSREYQRELLLRNAQKMGI